MQVHQRSSTMRDSTASMRRPGRLQRNYPAGARLPPRSSKIRVTTRDMQLTKDTGTNVASQDKTRSSLKQKTSAASIEFEKTILTDNGRRLFGDFVKSRDAFNDIIERAASLAVANRDARDSDADAVARGQGWRDHKREQASSSTKMIEAKTRAGQEDGGEQRCGWQQRPHGDRHPGHRRSYCGNRDRPSAHPDHQGAGGRRAQGGRGDRPAGGGRRPVRGGATRLHGRHRPA